ncbi:MAG: methylated-DNA--[protein]-cysteine S-methyltransferase [Ignavibacteria bacterium]|nr:MAG: methylated-DNA--[protein]-cysteine S-methyltransferase [Ignavibacteria bacterium]
MPEDLATIETASVANSVKRRTKFEGEREGGTGPGAQDTRTKIYCTSFDSRIGRIYVASTEKGVCKISVPKESRKDFFEWLKRHFDLENVLDNRARNKEVIDQLSRYFNGKLAKFTCPVDLLGTPFQIRVWKELSKISYGTTITYKHLAKRVAAPKASQAVGRANSANPLPIIVPCHRVLGSNGALVGYSCGVKTKEFLLRLEGAIIL